MLKLNQAQAHGGTSDAEIHSQGAAPWLGLGLDHGTGCSRCYPARYFGNLEGLEGSETKGFWTAASAHMLRLPSIVVQVFKVLTSSEKYVKIPENYFRKVRCFPKDSGRFRVVSGTRNLRRGLPERSKSCTVL